MKLNLVADYELPNGKRFVTSFVIHESHNLVGLVGMCSVSFPTVGGDWVYFKPKSLTMCESGRKAEMVAKEWERLYKEAGRLYDYSPVDPYEYHKYTEGAA
jgi:hypothetical protein